jgi:hypothetical protein
VPLSTLNPPFLNELDRDWKELPKDYSAATANKYRSARNTAYFRCRRFQAGVFQT